MTVKKKIEPIAVYKKNLNAAVNLRSREPQIPIIKTIGIKIISKNI